MFRNVTREFPDWQNAAVGSRYDSNREIWVVVRVDLFQLRDGRVPDDPRLFVTVKELVGSEGQAEAEVVRLTALKD